MELNEAVTQCKLDSLDWFPEAFNLEHMMIALVGEVGEAFNEYKKGRRGSTDPATAEDRTGKEFVDVFIYLMNIFAVLDIDLEEAYRAKRSTNQRRFDHGAGRLASIPGGHRDNLVRGAE